MGKKRLLMYVYYHSHMMRIEQLLKKIMEGMFKWFGVTTLYVFSSYNYNIQQYYREEIYDIHLVRVFTPYYNKNFIIILSVVENFKELQLLSKESVFGRKVVIA